MASSKEAPAKPEWYVSVPFSDVEKLLHEKEFFDEMKKENEQLRREMTGLQNMFNELLVVFGEWRRELNGR